MKKVDILGVEFDFTTQQEILNILQDKIERNKKAFVVTANPEIVMYANKDPQYMHTLQFANHIIADGVGVILGSKIVRQPLPERIAGFDLMIELLSIANQKGLRVFFLGASEQTLEKMIPKIKRDYPKLVIAGYHHGFFKGHEHKVKQMVKEAKADLVFVALGYPKQEEWIQKNIDSFEKGIFMGIGGSFDILAGTVKRAPGFWRNLNLEWLYRLIQQPTRWKRMLALPTFVKKMFQYRRKSSDNM
ncbi:acetylglucosaminyldiphosphoundecaprenol acetyl-beta-D-mannosaminyltransferase [Lederbergia ruris]|uniref:N-acetylglucosaminyldiphosphoundecaprenol N-acetyl-beta-D-mannosaminyltransferase n=1 Tax=Lederbergia ruris TaxID=217495 RepID=A0ABQ4KH01_9BACI|nr:acetylglucosaminyldiphosphoundecaprenol acetyl-beta-D-mannosaminyltransferase [Lederbergia ruris]